MKLLDGLYGRTQEDPIVVPNGEDFEVLEDGMKLLWTDGHTYLWNGEQYETDPIGNAIIFHEGRYLAVHMHPPSYERGTYGAPPVE